MVLAGLVSLGILLQEPALMVLAGLVSLGILLQEPALMVLAVLVSLVILLQAPALMVLAVLASLEILLQAPALMVLAVLVSLVILQAGDFGDVFKVSGAMVVKMSQQRRSSTIAIEEEFLTEGNGRQGYDFGTKDNTRDVC
jgi:hypothetical protein